MYGIDQMNAKPQTSFSRVGVSTSQSTRRITDGTSTHQVHKAISTWLNGTSATDYNVPVLLGDSKVLLSN